MIDALRAHVPSFYAGHVVPVSVRATLDRLLVCRTAVLGGHVFVCAECGFRVPMYNSCRSRYCSQCQGGRRRAWLEAQRARMLPVPHFHVVFTLPSELRSLALANPRLVYETLFAAQSYVLQTLGRQRLAGGLAITSVLHTWTREMGYHPHVHCIVSAGVLREDGTWKAVRGKWLFPHAVMQRMFGGFVLARLRQRLGQRFGTLVPRRVRQRLYRKSWVVFVDPPAGRDASHLAAYLARYVHQIAISDHRVVSTSKSSVTIRTRGTKTVTVPGAEFVRRFALHFLPKGFRKTRHYGLQAPSNRGRLEQARAAVLPTSGDDADTDDAANADDTDAAEADETELPELRCPRCGGPIQVFLVLAWSTLARGPP